MGLIRKLKDLNRQIYMLNEKADLLNRKADWLREKEDILLKRTEEFEKIHQISEELDRVGHLADKCAHQLDCQDVIIGRIEAKQDRVRRGVARIESRQINGDTGIEFQAYSQWGEDGIIQYLVRNLDIPNRVFIEFGVENYTEANTRFLLVNNRWAGLVMDGDENNIETLRQDPVYWTYNLKAEKAFITAENINDLIRSNGISGRIGLLSIDIDGNDYWVWKAIDAVDPDIVICEYNPRFGMERSVTVPYKADLSRFDAHYSGIVFGASIRALVSLGREKGYSLVCGNEANLFFVKTELLNDAVKECTVEAAYLKNGYQDSRDESGRLKKISYEEEQEIIRAVELTEV